MIEPLFKPPQDIRAIPSLLLIGVAVLVLLSNWGALLMSLWLRWRGQHYSRSLVPLVGPIAGTLGLLIYPAKLGWYVLSFWVVEPMVVLAPFALLFAAYKYLRKRRD